MLNFLIKLKAYTRYGVGLFGLWVLLEGRAEDMRDYPLSLVTASYTNSVVPDAEGYICDWVEIKNNSGSNVSLSNWYIGKEKTFLKSQDEGKLIRLPAGTIKARQSVYVFLDKTLTTQDGWKTSPDGRVTWRSNVLSLGTNSSGGWDKVYLYEEPGALRTKWESGDNAPKTAARATLRVNEIAYKNNTLADSEGVTTNDWIELHNFGTQPIDLGGFLLGKKKDVPSCRAANALITLPALTLPAGGYALVFLNKDLPPQTAWQTNDQGRVSIRRNEFSLGTTTDDVTGDLIQDSVRLFDYAYYRLSNIKGDSAIGILPDGCTYGYAPNSDTVLTVFAAATPWAANTAREWIAPPAFSQKSGCYATAPKVLLSQAKGARIRYTLDGTDPRNSSTALEVASGASVTVAAREDATETSGAGATNAWIRTSPPELENRQPGAGWFKPIGSVARISPLRAVAVLGSNQSAETVATYLVGSDYASRKLPVVAVTVNPADFFSDETGIYVPGLPYKQYGYGSNKWGKNNANYFQVDEFGDDWERSGNFELFEPNESAAALNLKLGYAMHGGATRSLPQKTLYCLLRGDYGTKDLTYPLIPEIGTRTYKRFMLRNNGNDFYGPLTEGVSSLMKDAVFHRIAAPLDMGVEAFRPATVYINGDYWGIHNIRESLDKHYFATRYGLNADYVDILSHEETTAEDARRVDIVRIAGSKEADEDYEKFLSGIANYTDPYKQLAESIDIPNFIDYLIIETFYANTDWPFNNCDFWRVGTNYMNGAESTKPFADHKWRWTLYDLDLTGSVVSGSGGVNVNMFTYLTLTSSQKRKPEYGAFLINKFWAHEDYVNQFVARYQTVLNTVLKPERTHRVIKEAGDHIRDEVEQHYHRWGRNFTVQDWEKAVEKELTSFCAQRWTNSFNHLSSKFVLGGVGELTVLNQASTGVGGHFRVSDIEIEPTTEGVTNRAAWTGRFFAKNLVTVEAIPDAGYVFDGWVGSLESAATREVKVVANDEVILMARFRRAGTPAHETTGYEVWQASNYRETDIVRGASAVAPDAIAIDEAGEQFSNFELFAFGMRRNDGLTPAQRRARESLSISANPKLSLSYIQTANPAGLDMSVWTATTLTGSWQRAVLGVDYSTGVVTDQFDQTSWRLTVPLKENSAGRFYRVKALMK